MKNKKKTNNGDNNAAKRAKPTTIKEEPVVEPKHHDHTTILIVDTVWQHYHNFIDSCTESSDGTGDIDELQEIVAILMKHNIVGGSSSSDGSTNRCWYRNHDDDAMVGSRQEMLPVLLSVAHGCLADYYITEYFNNNNNNDTTTVEEVAQQIQHHLVAALTAVPWNASVWSMTANWCRMQLSSNTRYISECLHMGHVIAAYLQAAEYAHSIRNNSIAWLDDEDDCVTEPVKEWIEMLLLNQIAAVEWMEDEDIQEPEQEDPPQQDSSVDNNGYWSSSSVESTARFMSAMLFSILGTHDKARHQLEYFPELTHRLHPNVWNAPQTAPQLLLQQADASATDNNSPVVVFRDNVLPSDLYDRLCQVFCPDANYWKQSDYENRGYYSYFMDRPKSDSANNNLLEHVIFHYLWPLARQQLTPSQADSVCGAEWWVHTRPVQSNLGHNMHFDTDEALLEQSNEITHPVVSSVLYLTGGHRGGATVVLDQTPAAETNADSAWISVPSNNSYLVFPGNRLHGVLPCRLESHSTVHVPESVQVSDLFPTVSKKETASKDHAEKPPHRLTFMVGFWTRRVPDNIKDRSLYSPCGPLPPPTNEHSWVQQCLRGYGANVDTYETPTALLSTSVPQATALLKVSPAWECLESAQDPRMKGPPLQIPRALDHRFFVQNAPKCFYDSLFEKDCDDNEVSDDD